MALQPLAFLLFAAGFAGLPESLPFAGQHPEKRIGGAVEKRD